MEGMEDAGAATEIVSDDSNTKMGGSGSKSRGDRVRVSGLGKTDDSDSAAVGECVAEADTVVHSSYDEDCVLGDNENEKVGLEDVAECDVYTNGSANVVDADDGEGKEENDGEDAQESQFCVGDLVWGKIRSHPWWPGQVYDPNDASEFALKSKQKGRLLVAFFGDGSWSWCLPSQLVPFVENFAGMSRKSSSRSFLNAVQCAIDEIGRLVESEMACNCVDKERKDGLARPMAENSGIKAGVIVPKVDSSRLLIRRYESKELVEKVKQFSRTVSICNTVDLTVLRSYLSAFYYFKGGYQLSSYQEPLSVEGLEDKNDNVDEGSNGFNVLIEAPIVGGPKDDDWHSSPTGNKVFHKRKRKSVAELMGENKNSVNKSASSRKRKKSNDGGEEEASDQGASLTGKTGKRRKIEATESPKEMNEVCSNAEKNGANKGPLSGKPKKTKVADVKISSDEAKEELEMVSTPRERKKSKYLSPPYTNPTWRIGNFSSRPVSVAEHDKNTREGGQTTPNPVSEPVDEMTVEKMPNAQLESSDVSVDMSPQTVKDDKNTTSVSDVYASVSQLLLKTRLAAVDPFYLSNEGSLDMVWAFVYALRSSTYVHGPNYKIYRKCKNRGKRKWGPSQVGNDGTHKKVNSPDQNASNGSKAEELLNASKSRKPAETSGAKSNPQKVDGKTMPCFIMEFAPDFPLPSKEDVVRLFSKFGSPSKNDVKVVTESHSIQICFANYSDAEAAFKSSMSDCPFGFENVTCRLLHPSTSSKSGPKVSSPLKRSSHKQEDEDDLILEARVIRQKSEILTNNLEKHEPKISPEDRSILKEEMKDIMEKIEAINHKVRVIGENIS